MTAEHIDKEMDKEGAPTSLFLKANLNIIKLLDFSGKLVAVICMWSMFAALLVNVILRYFFGSGIPWAYEIHAILLPWLVSGGIVVASARSQNIAITLLFDMLSVSKRHILEIAIAFIIIVIAVCVLWTSQPILRAAQYQNLTTLGIKQIWGYSGLIYAFSCMAIISFLDLLRLLFSRNSSTTAHKSFS